MRSLTELECGCGPESLCEEARRLRAKWLSVARGYEGGDDMFSHYVIDEGQRGRERRAALAYAWHRREMGEPLRQAVGISSAHLPAIARTRFGKKPGGRLSEQERWTVQCQVVERLRMGAPLHAATRDLAVDRRTIYVWLNKDSEFRAAVTRARRRVARGGRMVTRA